MKLFTLSLSLALALSAASSIARAEVRNWDNIRVCRDRSEACTKAYREVLKLAAAHYLRLQAFNAEYSKEYNAFHQKTDLAKKRLRRMPETSERSAALEAAEATYWADFSKMEKNMRARRESQIFGAHRNQLPRIKRLLQDIPELANNPSVVKYQLLTGDQAKQGTDEQALTPFFSNIEFPESKTVRQWECVDDDRRQNAAPLTYVDEKYPGAVGLVIWYNHSSGYGQKANTLSFRVFEETDTFHENRNEHKGSYCSEREFEHGRE